MAEHPPPDSQADKDLANRSLPATFVYLAIYLPIITFTPLPDEYRFISICVGIAIAIGSLVRAICVWRFERIYQRSPLLWRFFFSISTLTLAGAWGALGLITVLAYEFDWNTMVVLLSVAGFSAGAVTTLSIHLKLNIAYLLLIALPPIVTTFSLQTQQAYLTTFIFLVYLIFLSGVSYRLNREYWLTLYNTRSLSNHAKELASTNEELEAFNYSVSHDLRAPIRAIDGFSQALAEDAGHKLDTHELDHVARIRKSVSRMGGLVDDLLELSRITRRKILFKTVNLSRLASSIVENIQPTHPHRHVTVDIQPNMQVWGDERLLGILLDNLIGNAWKYTCRADHAEITVGETSIDSQRTFFVRDNGVGFDMQYANKLFAPFQRLHGNQDFPGEGIGLATAYRVIQRHNGRIWGESLVDNYTTFYFALGAQASFDA